MDSLTDQKIKKLNTDFYNKIAEDFSATRERPWKGWDRVGDIVNEYFTKKVSILDIGCGNGRFYEFMSSRSKNDVTYLGIDNNKKLLKIAKDKNINVREADIDNLEITDKYDLVTLFGVTHHLPWGKNTTDWFKFISNCVNKKGLLIITFWHFNINKAKSPRLNFKLNDNDYILGWKNLKNAHRYCHLYKPEEIEEIIKIYTDLGFKLLDHFVEDKTKYEWNDYIIMSN